MGDIIKAGASVTTFWGIAGVCVAVLAAISVALIKKGVFPAITKAASAETVNRILVGLFILAILCAVLGFFALAMQNNTDTLRLFMVLVFFVFVLVYFVPRQTNKLPPKPEKEPQTVYDKLRNKGSRELGSVLRGVYTEYAQRWVQVLNARDTPGRQGLANGLYDNLRTIVHDHDGRVEHKECWKRLVKLRDNVQVWKHNQQLLPSDVSTLIDELRDLAIDFPMEAESSSRQAGDTQPPLAAASDGSTPIQVCGQALARICQTYAASWEAAKETHNLRNCCVVIDNMLAAVDASSAHHESAASADPRFQKLVTFRAYCKKLSIRKVTDEDFIDTWGPIFFELQQIAHGFQLSR